jgi:hypothetical protein
MAQNMASMRHRIGRPGDWKRGQSRLRGSDSIHSRGVSSVPPITVEALAFTVVKALDAPRLVPFIPLPRLHRADQRCLRFEQDVQHTGGNCGTQRRVPPPERVQRGHPCPPSYLRSPRWRLLQHVSPIANSRDCLAFPVAPAG